MDGSSKEEEEDSTFTNISLADDTGRENLMNSEIENSATVQHFLKNMTFITIVKQTLCRKLEKIQLEK